MKLEQLKEASRQKAPATTIGEAMLSSGQMARWQRYGPFNQFHGLLKWDFAMRSVISWEGCPQKFVTSSTYGMGGIDIANTSINSFEHCDIKESETVRLAQAKITDLHDIYKHIITRRIVIPVAMNMVGVLLIEGLTHIFIKPAGPILSETEKRLEAILRKHLTDQDVATCQEELIQAGFEDEAGI